MASCLLNSWTLHRRHIRTSKRRCTVHKPIPGIQRALWDIQPGIRERGLGESHASSQSLLVSRMGRIKAGTSSHHCWQHPPFVEGSYGGRNPARAEGTEIGLTMVRTGKTTRCCGRRSIVQRVDNNLFGLLFWSSVVRVRKQITRNAPVLFVSSPGFCQD